MVALRAPLWDLPLERDEGEYAYIAWRMSEGELPYRDWFDQKPPGVFLAYRLALALPADPLIAIRGVAAVFSAASALALFFCVRGLLGTAAGVAAALLLAFLSADPMLQGPIANTELFVLPWLCIAAALLVHALGDARARPALGLAIGASLGIATAFKQVALVNAALFVALFWLRAREPGRARRSARFAAELAAGGLSVWGAIGLWLWRGGALEAAVDAILLHNLDYVAQLGLAERAALFRYSVPPLVPSQAAAWLLAAAGLVLLARRPDVRFPALFLGGFAAANAIGTSASGLFFPHYFQPMLPAVAALGAAVVAGGGDPRVEPRRAALRWLGVALALAPLVVAAAGFWRLDPDEAVRRIYPGAYFEAMPAIGAELAAQTAQGDRIFVFGSEPEIFFYARRVSASRYIFLDPAFGTSPDAAQRQAEVIAELEAAPPAAVLWIPTGRMQPAPGRPQELTRSVTLLLGSAYRLHAVVAPEGESRGVLRRLEPGVEPRVPRDAWALLFVRAHPAAPTR